MTVSTDIMFFAFSASCSVAVVAVGAQHPKGIQEALHVNGGSGRAFAQPPCQGSKGSVRSLAQSLGRQRKKLTVNSEAFSESQAQISYRDPLPSVTDPAHLRSGGQLAAESSGTGW